MKIKPSSEKFWCFGKVVAYERWSHVKVGLLKKVFSFKLNRKVTFRVGLEPRDFRIANLTS